MITQKEIKRQLRYSPETGIFTNRIQRSSSALEGDVSGCPQIDGYLSIKVSGRSYLAHRLAWLYVYGFFPENEIDHIDRSPDNNRIANLREVSHQCNMRNRKVQRNNESGVAGVHRDTLRNKWRAKIKINYKTKNLGLFDDFTEAVAHRLAAEQCLEWAGCDSNSSAFRYVQKYLRCRQKKIRD